jgi:anaerobic magnesium-protoporphyrin IX monomethyl ester cyclase
LRVALVHVQYHEGNNVFPPLGLLYVASALRDAGHQVTVFDEDPRTRLDLSARVAALRPELVGLSFMTMCWDRARDLAQDLRARLPDAWLIAGGPHPTAEPLATVTDFELDAVVVGEGEVTAVELALALESGASLVAVPGVVTRDGAGPDRVFIDDLDQLSFPARDLLGHEPYLRPPGLIRGYASSRIASMLAGRGCVFKCTFCESHRQLGTRVRIRSVANVMAELELLVERDRIRGMYWVDDVFTHHREWLLELCDALVAKDWDLKWGCQARVTAVDGALLRAMKRAGCVQVDFGVESGSDRVLKSMHKGITSAAVVDAFAMTKAVGLRTGASFIIGSPGETEEDLAATAALADRIRSDWTVFFYSTPYPGSDLGRTARTHDEAWPEWGEDWNNRVGPVPIAQGSLPREILVQARSDLQNRHFRRNYLRIRNVPFMLRLARTLRRPTVRRALVRTATSRARWDDVVEAAFSEWRGS